MSKKATKKAKAEVATFPKLSTGAHELFIALWKDADNWSGTPLFGGNVGGDAESKGYLTKLKKAKLLTTQVDDERKDCSWVTFTELGKALAEELKLDAKVAAARVYDERNGPEPVVTTPAPAPVELSGRTAPERETRNGIKRPAPGGRCAAVWQALDKMHAGGMEPTTKQVRELAVAKHWSENNAVCELSRWRRYMGVGRTHNMKPKKRQKAQARAARPAMRTDGSVDQYLA